LENYTVGRSPQPSGKQNRSSDKSQEQRLLKTVIAASLANAGAQEAPVVVHADLAASQKIRYSRYRFPVAVRAGTYHQDKVTQRKPCASF
jgi:hypothetical protein